MRYSWLSILIVVLAASCGKKDENRFSKITPKLDSLFAAEKDFSGVVLLADSGKVVYHKAFGFRNIETREPMDTTSIFELASVSKQFTAMVIMMLKEEGKLSYDDPLEKYIPGLPYPGITIRHLLTHTSGLPDYQKVMDEHWDKTKVAGNEECIAYLNKYAPPREFEPGHQYNYSNTGYLLLASIAEKASGIDFIAFSRTRIFVPLKMTSTDIRTMEEKEMLRNMAWGQYIDSTGSSNYLTWLGNRKGPGRISSCSSDLLKWDQALYHGKLVSDATLQEAFQPMRTDSAMSHYGFGWQLSTDPKLGRVVRHSGDNPGYKTHIVRFIDKNRTVILLSNNAYPRFNYLLEKVIAGFNL